MGKVRTGEAGGGLSLLPVAVYACLVRREIDALVERRVRVEIPHHERLWVKAEQAVAAQSRECAHPGIAELRVGGGERIGRLLDGPRACVESGLLDEVDAHGEEGDQRQRSRIAQTAQTPVAPDERSPNDRDDGDEARRPQPAVPRAEPEVAQNVV